MARGPTWSDEELQVLAENPDLKPVELVALLPGRTVTAISQTRHRLKYQRSRTEPAAVPAVKEPGDYVETLACYLVDEFDCMEIWMRWNGYSSYRELSRTHGGWVTLLCTAK